MEQSVISRFINFFKKVLGVEDVSLLKKNIKKKIGKVIYHKRYSAKDLVSLMQDMGLKKGSVVCIHSSMKELYNYHGSAKELIDEILKVLTEEGTLLMPAYPDPKLRQDDNYVFDGNQDPTKAGYLAEEFRKYPGVVRSINVQHSVCGWGKYSEYLLKEHHLCENCWDELSPYYKMTQMNALVFNIGLPDNFIGTFSHCVEGVLYRKYKYWAQFFTDKKTYKYLDSQGKIKEYNCLEGNIERRMKPKYVERYLCKEWYVSKRISNLHIRMFQSGPCLERMIELGEKGISRYYIPSSKGFKFNE